MQNDKRIYLKKFLAWTTIFFCIYLVGIPFSWDTIKEYGIIMYSISLFILFFTIIGLIFILKWAIKIIIDE